MKQEKCIIVAMSPKGVIGLGNGLPWRITEDLKVFKKLTVGCSVVMGRNTFESIGRPLPNRENIVVSNKLKNVPGAFVASSISAAIDAASKKRVFFIGGRNIYEHALEFANVMYISHIKQDYYGDVYFPEISKEWNAMNTVEFAEFYLKKYARC